MTLVTSGAMRTGFYVTAAKLLDQDDRLTIVIAEIGGAGIYAAQKRHPDRVFNVGIREQLMVSVAGGLGLAGLRPILHSYTPFLIERPFEMLKLDLGHLGVGAVLVSIGASYDSAASGRTHQAPEDVAIVSSLPGWRVFVPGHPDEADLLFRAAARDDDRVYIRLCEQVNREPRPVEPGRMHVERHGRAATVIAVGPLLDPVLEATADLDVTILYATTVRPFDGETLRRALAGDLIVLVEPYLRGTSSGEVADSLAHVRHRTAAIGVPNVEHRHYGSWTEHNAAHGLDARGIRRSIVAALGSSR